MKKTIPFILVILMAAACENGPGSGKAVDTTITISYDTVPETRQKISKEAVAHYSEPIKDDLNKWTFSVDIYETPQTFQYTMLLQAQEAHVTDSLKIPNFGIWPKPAIERGKEPLTCIVGFLDNKQQFKPYKKVSFHHNQLRVSSVASYYVASYKTPVKKPANP